MIIALALVTAAAALTGYSLPQMYMQPGWARSAAQLACVIVALLMGQKVAGFGPPPPPPLSFSQWTFASILVLGGALMLFLRSRK